VTHAIDLRTSRTAGQLSDERPPVLLTR
jgi:hypothetical protein